MAAISKWHQHQLNNDGKVERPKRKPHISNNWDQFYRHWFSNYSTWVAGFVGIHYGDITMDTMTSQITSLTIVYSTVYSGVDQRKHQSSASLAFVRGIHRGPVNSPHKWPATRKMFPFDDVIMSCGSHWRHITYSLVVVNLFANNRNIHVKQYSTHYKHK